jgi:hypothetical protein
MHYVTNASEQAKVKEQQKEMLKALQDLSVTAKLQQQQESERQLSRQHYLKSQLQNRKRSISSNTSFDACFDPYSTTRYLEVAPECRPYSPYTQTSTSTPTSTLIYNTHYNRMNTSASSTTSSLIERQRTPSVSSAISSFISENSSSSQDSEDKENDYISVLETTER